MFNRRRRPLALAGLTLLAWLMAPALATADPLLRPDLKPAIDYAKRNKGRSVLIQRGEKILLEDYHNGGSRRKPNYLASGTKSFWGIAVAAMVEDDIVASFDEPVADTLTEWQDDPVKRRISVRHLLSLSSGLSEDMQSLGGTRGGAINKYAAAIALPAVARAGERFRYGPSHFYALGEFMKRKLTPQGLSPLGYLKQRILDPIGAQVGDWLHDKSGNPNIPNGASMTARSWARFGLLVAQEGKWEGRQLVRADLVKACLTGSRANPGYGLTFWTNRPGGRGFRPAEKSALAAPGGWIYPLGYPDLVGAMGAGKTRMYLIPSADLVIVRQAQKHRDAFEDPEFLKLVLKDPNRAAYRPASAAVLSASWNTQGSEHVRRMVERLDKDGDGMLSRDEIPPGRQRLRQNFERFDRNGNGRLDAAELDALGGRGAEGIDSRSARPGMPGRLLPWLLISALVLGVLLVGSVAWLQRRPSSRRASDRRRVQALAVVRPLPATSWQRNCRLDPVADPIVSYLKASRVPGMQLVILNRDEILLERVFGNLDTRHPREIASASKWLSTMVFMRLVDAGILDLDSEIVEWLPEMRGQKAKIRLRDLLSCTSGFPARVPWLMDEGIDLEENVRRIAEVALSTPPARSLIYGGVGFQVAGRIAEVATSKPWQALFDEHVVKPLGLADTFFPANKTAGTAWVPRAWRNPHIGGGGRSTATDYARFLRMFLADGELEGQRILSPRAVREMQIDQTLGLDPIFSPHWVADAGYGLGAWVEARGPHGLGTRLSCAGAQGCLPWVDLELGYAGIIIAPCETRRLVRPYEALLPLIAESLGRCRRAAA